MEAEILKYVDKYKMTEQKHNEVLDILNKLRG